MLAKALFAGASALALFPATPLLAQAAEDAAPTEIVVTAQRREQSARDVGISITSFGAVEIAQRNITASVDVARVTPGAFVSSSGGGQFAQFSIRGVTQNDINDYVEGPVAVYVDDTYVPSLQGQSFGLFDLERVEVLRGPQGTLFGRNATGGLVHFVVAKPTEELSGHADITYGSYDQTKVDAAIGGTIAGNLTGRASLYWNRADAWMKNVYPGSYGAAPNPTVTPCCDDAGNEDTLAGRLQLQFAPSDDLTIRGTFSAMRQKLSTAPYNQVATVPVVNAAGGVVGGIYASPTETRTAIGPDGQNYTGIGGSPAARAPGADWFGFLAPDAEDLEFASDYSNSDAQRVRSYDAALHIDYDMGDVHLVSITNARKLTKGFGLDADASPISFVNVWSEADTRSFSQEVRASGGTDALTWTAGAYYLYLKTRSTIGYVAPANSIFAGIVGFPTTGVDLANENRIVTNSLSAFGQVEYKLAPRLTVIAGGRIIRERQHFSVASGAYSITNVYDIDPDQYLFEAQQGFEDRRAKTLWAGKLQLEYRPVADTLLYAGVSRGVKAGNFNSKLPDGSPALPTSAIPYKAETLIAYEGGLKQSFLNGLGLFTASGFYYDYRNYQAFFFSNASGYTQNRDARSYGAEFELGIQPVARLHLGASLSLISPKVKDLQITDGVSRDVDPAFTPHRQLGGEISYRVPDVFGGKLTFAANGHYNSSFYQNIRNFDSQKLPGYTVFNGSVTWLSDSGFTAAFVLDNVFDKRYAITAFDLSTLCGCTEIAYGKPRWWGVRTGYKF